MPGPLPIQQKFLALLQGTITFFATPQPQSMQDRKMVEQQRNDALRLAEEAAQPAFERFLAYLLSSTSIDAHYPLQTIRFLSIVARATRLMPELAKPQIHELLTAAYFCDIGFRAAWLGQKGTHSELTAFRLKEMGFAWFTPGLEAMLLGHHDVAADISPHHVLSLTATYLASVYGLGVDVGPSITLSPVKGLEALIQSFPTQTEGIRILLRCLSAYPLGSWVQANTGQVGFVVGANPDHPLRPRLGYAAPNAQGVWRWEEHPLEKEPRLELQRELHPTASQLNFANAPQLWMTGWQSQTPFAKEEYLAAFGAVTSTDGSVSTSPALEDFLGGLEGGVKPPASMGAPGGGLPLPPAANGASPAGSDPNSELQHLRSDWEKHVHLIEESVEHLRHGLIESYQRENKQVRAELDVLKKQQPSVAAAPSSAKIESLESELGLLEEQIAQDEKNWREPHSALENLCDRVRSSLAALLKNPARPRSLETLLPRWQAEWDAITAQLIAPLDPLPAAFLALKEECARGRVSLSRLKERSQTPELALREQTLWEGRYRPALERCKSKAEEAQREQRRCIERVQHLAQRYLDVAERLETQ